MSEDQKKWLIVGLICLIIGVAYWYFLYQKQSAQIQDLETKITDLDRKITKAEGQVAKLETLEAEMEVLKAQWQEALKFLPTHDEIENVLKSIELAIRDSNLKKFSFSPGEPEPYDFYSEQRIGLVLEGEFPDFLSFLNRLRQFDRIVKPKNINSRLKTRNPTDKDFVMSINMTVSAYILGGSEEVQ